MSAMGELNFFLGLQVLQKEDGIFLSQDKYVGDILKKFGYIDVRSSNTPMDKENPWRKEGTGKDVDLHLYRSMIGSLMYLTASRPYIMFAICACARNQVTPREYSDYGGATQDRISTTEGCQFLGRRLSMSLEAFSREFSTSILRLKSTSLVESDIQTNATMADNRTMAQMLQASIEGYEDAIVVPPINANNFELK
nr:hypothetical protein [Tanacetum cinerariifolium]